jgi:hypothetical protein
MCQQLQVPILLQHSEFVCYLRKGQQRHTTLRKSINQSNQCCRVVKKNRICDTVEVRVCVSKTVPRFGLFVPVGMQPVRGKQFQSVHEFFVGISVMKLLNERNFSRNDKPQPPDPRNTKNKIKQPKFVSRCKQATEIERKRAFFPSAAAAAALGDRPRT